MSAISAHARHDQRIRESIATLAVAAVLYTALRCTLLLVVVEGRSIWPTFREGRHLLVNRLAPRLHPPCRGAVVVLAPRSPGQPPIVKRLIGLPGERIAIHEGVVSINGIALREPYLIERPADTYPPDGESLTLGRDAYFVLGDNRGASEDSRVFGPIGRGVMLGVVWNARWPFRRSPPIAILHVPRFRVS